MTWLEAVREVVAAVQRSDVTDLELSSSEFSLRLRREPSLVVSAQVTPDARSDGYQEGHARGYADGTRDGRAAGLREGRALQVPLRLPSGAGDAATAAFKAGYAAGANDVFGGYDGGWDTDRPYVVVLTAAGNGIVYRIRSRTPMQPGVTYRLCPNSTVLCQGPG